MSGTPGIKIKVRDGENANYALKKFKRMVESYGVIREYRNRKENKKPSVKKKEKLKAAEKRRKKEINKRRRSKI